ncbi:hypothetical protein CLAIMM_14372 [Cladophialophora immunda]|nr:hypothetical protein CLAIMM_14372 [Cladophialophora immunda]
MPSRASKRIAYLNQTVLDFCRRQRFTWNHSLSKVSQLFLKPPRQPQHIPTRMTSYLVVLWHWPYPWWTESRIEIHSSMLGLCYESASTSVPDILGCRA